MGTNAQTLWHSFATAATILAGIVGRNRKHLTPGACCLGFEDATELAPRRITDALGEVFVPYHIGDLQIFEVDGIVVA